MNTPIRSAPDAARSRLRTAVAAIEHEISQMSRPPEQAMDDDGSGRKRLLAAWNDLVEELALGPEPEVRECPVCHHVGMRAATRCGYCWTRLTPPTERQDASP